MDHNGWELFVRSTDTRSPREKLAGRVGSRDVRAWIHALLLLGGAALILGLQQVWQDPTELPRQADKLAHYQLGRALATGLFFVAYFCTVARVLLTNQRSVAAAIIWIPLLLLVAAVLATGATVGIGAAKEFFDLTAAGDVEWADFAQTAAGAFAGASSIVPGVAVVMALTPLLIPLDILLQMPRLMLEDVRTGVMSLDRYVQARRAQSGDPERSPVLLVEDDIHCATTALNYCAALGLRCHHVATIAEADAHLGRHADSTRLVLLDNFVRVDASGRNTTGAEWLETLERRFPRDRRPFRVVIISGHLEAVDRAARLADLMLQKPWKPAELNSHLNAWVILPDRPAVDSPEPAETPCPV
jgi:CheY-like chemotaxis protein